MYFDISFFGVVSFSLYILLIKLLQGAIFFHQTPGLRALPTRLNGYCELLIENERIDELDRLVKATKELFGVDRPKLYKYLLDGMSE